MNKRVMWGAAFGLTVLLSACGTSSISGEAARAISGQVADYDGPAGTLEAVAGFIKLPQAGTGSIEADGTFAFELEESPTEFINSPIAPCAEVTASDTAAKLLNVAQFSVVVDGRLMGTLSQSRDDVNSNKSLPLPEILVSRAYVDRDVTVKGACTFTVLGTQITSAYDLAYRQGWNTLLTKTSFSADGLSAESKVTLATASDIENTEWSY